MHDVSASVVALQRKADALRDRVTSVVTLMEQEASQCWTSLERYASTKRSLSTMLASASRHQHAALDQGRLLVPMQAEVVSLYRTLDFLDFQCGYERTAELTELAKQLGEINYTIDRHITKAEDNEDTPDLE